MMMLGMEDVLCELSDHEKKNQHGLPPGFRFHPTDEELITYYLASKVYNGNGYGTFSTLKFAEVDLNRCEPWELPGTYVLVLVPYLHIYPPLPKSILVPRTRRSGLHVYFIFIKQTKR